MPSQHAEAPPSEGRWWFPALLSVAWPGVGQLYKGSWRGALLFAVGVPLVTILCLGLAVALPIARLNVVPLLFILAVQLAAILDAARDPTVGQATGTRPWYRRWYVCVALAGLYVFVVAPVWIGVMRVVWVQAYAIPTGSMKPTILRGDHVLVSKLTYGLRSPFSGARIASRGEPQRGDLVVYLFPEDPRREFLHRVVGLPGERVEIRDRRVLIDSKPLEEPYAQYGDSPQRRADWGPTTVPPGHVFMLGDNRDNSRDSRFWGFVPVEDVFGQARMVYYSIDRDTPQQSVWPRVRWGRVGTILTSAPPVLSPPRE